MNQRETKRMAAWLGAHPKAWAKRMGRAKSELELAQLAGRVKLDGRAQYDAHKAGERLGKLIDEARAAGGLRRVEILEAALRLSALLENERRAPILELAFAELELEALSKRATAKLAKELKLKDLDAAIETLSRGVSESIGGALADVCADLDGSK